MNFKSSASSAFLSMYRLPILAGILIGTSYIPFPPWALFFCLVPLFVFWMRAPSAKSAFLGGWITQFLLNLIGFHWIAYTAIEFGHFPWWGGVGTLLGFCAIAHLYYAVTGWVAFRLTRQFKLSEGFSIFVFATVFALLDHRFPMIFPWHLGYPWLWAGLPGAQIADVIGFEGLNILTIYINALVAWSVLLWMRRRREQTKPTRYLTPAVLALALITAVNLVGLGRAEKWAKTDAELNVLAVQGNIGNFDKIMAERGRAFREPIIRKYIDMSRKGLQENPQTQLMIWPETAFPDLLDLPYQNEPNAMAVREFTEEVKIPLLTGAYSYDATTRNTYNAMAFVDSMGRTPLSPYRKSILLVFGETFPFSEYIPYMDKLFPNMGSFGRGQGPTVMQTGLARIGAQICYEGLYPWFSAELSRQGAQILANVTNDSWFGNLFEPYQHLYMTVARAVEFRRPLIRATNTGITTVALATGELMEKSPLHQEWTGAFRMPYLTNPPHTFYEKIAGQWAWVLVFGLVLLIVFGRGRTQST